MRVSPLLAEALALALRAAQMTDGDVDPTVGSALILAGYDRDWSLLERPAAGSPSENSSVHEHPISTPMVLARAVCGWHSVMFDSVTRTVRIPAGFTIDLGATAKAWAADRAAQAAAQTAGCGALVAIGGDIATSGDAPVGGWAVHVTDDHRSDHHAPGQTVTIQSGGLATSSTAVRRWRHRGRTMHHIIDPATGAPARSTWRTVSVAAASCADANIATTLRAHTRRRRPRVAGTDGRAGSTRQPQRPGLHDRLLAGRPAANPDPSAPPPRLRAPPTPPHPHTARTPDHI